MVVATCPPVRPGHTPLAALRLLAPLSQSERGCGAGLFGHCLAGGGNLVAPLTLIPFPDARVAIYTPFNSPLSIKGEGWAWFPW